MSIKDAIEAFKAVIEDKTREFTGAYKTICKMAVDALEKQVEKPVKKPEHETHEYKGKCPVCDNKILYPDKYCSKCGQKVGDNGKKES